MIPEKNWVKTNKYMYVKCFVCIYIYIERERERDRERD